MKLAVPPRSLLAAEPPAAPSAAPATKNIVAWAPFLWRRVLFPGTCEQPGTLRRGAVGLVLATVLVVVVPRLDFHLFEPDEGRYAQIPKEMIDQGDWLVPTLQGEPYLDKPPLFYWLIASLYQVFGPADWVARLVPAAAVIACVMVVLFAGARCVGPKAAFWGAMLLSLSPGLVSMGRILVLDGLLTLWVTAALFCGYEAIGRDRFRRDWWLAMCFALGLGMLTKGPIALVLTLPPLFAHRWLTGRRFAVGRRAWVTLTAVLALINLPWVIAISLRHPEFGSYFLWKHNLQRFLAPFDHEQPIWFFLPVLVLGLAPAAWMLPLLGKFLIGTNTDTIKHRPPEMGFLLLAGLWCVGFFSLSGSKLPTYILPAFPPLCLALGMYVAASGWDKSRLFRGGLVVWGGLLIAGHVFALPAVAWMRSPMNHPAEADAVLQDPSVPVFCFPRPVDSVAFYLGRSDFHVYRSKELPEMLQAMDKHPRSVVLFAHRNSKLILTHNVPPHFRVVFVGKLGLCDMAIIERPGLP